MTTEIICKWWNPTLNIGVTESRDVYILQNNIPVQLVKEYHAGANVYRLPKTSKRFSKKKINSGIKTETKLLQDYCPF